MAVSKTGVITPDSQNRTFDNSSEFEADMKNNPDKYKAYAYTLWDADAEITCDWEPTTDPLDLTDGANANNEGKEMNEMENIFDIVMKLNGPICAVGDSNIDDERYKNLDKLIELTNKLLFIIEDAALSKDSYEASVAKIGKRASEYLIEVSKV